MDNLAQIESYLRFGTYPEGMSKGEKSNLRRKCHKNFKFSDGTLYHRTAAASDKEKWRACVRSEEEKERILESCHDGVGGRLTILESACC